MKKYSIEYIVQPSDIDELKHVNNIRYVEMVQEISKNHWFKAIEGKIPTKKYIWVIATHHLDYFRSAFLNEKLEIETHVRDFDGKYSNRVVNVRNQESGKLLFKALTKWCLIDVESQKTTEVTDQIASLFL